MKVLIACEESQIVCSAFRNKGHEAYSCDILKCSGKHEDWHILQNVLNVINPTNHNGTVDICFDTMDGKKHTIDRWNLIIAHPPCTYLTVTGNKWFKPEYKNRFPEREKQRNDAIYFFMKFVYADCPRIAIENPVGIMSTYYRKPDQYIEPFYFGDEEKKKTGLWLKNLPKLKPTEIVKPIIIRCDSGINEPHWHMETMKLPKEERSRIRSKTFPGIATAMAEQWG